MPKSTLKHWHDPVPLSPVVTDYSSKIYVNLCYIFLFYSYIIYFFIASFKTTYGWLELSRDCRIRFPDCYYHTPQRVRVEYLDLTTPYLINIAEKVNVVFPSSLKLPLRRLSPTKIVCTFLVPLPKLHVTIIYPLGFTILSMLSS